MTRTRIESDTMGEIALPHDRLWGAQTQRSLENFRIGEGRMPREIVHALGTIKLAAARLMVPNARISGTGIVSPPMRKFCKLRWVCAPHR